jgi:proline dehydrogenase
VKHTLHSIISACWLPLAKRAARGYIAGPELADALRTSRALALPGYQSTISYWEGPNEQPQRVARAYLAALDALACEPLDCYLSIKAPALGMDPGLVTEVLERGRHAGIRVHFDSLGAEAAEQTLSFIDHASSRSDRLGCTLPGRWRRSPTDADWAVERGLSVRVVKGQWADANGQRDASAGFLAVIDRLAGRASHVAVATHDPALACEALRRLQASHTSCEQELLFGLPVWPVLRVASLARVPVRLYVPYGEAWLPYCLSRAQENPRTIWWAFQDLVLGRRMGFPDTDRTELGKRN